VMSIFLLAELITCPALPALLPLRPPRDPRRSLWQAHSRSCSNPGALQMRPKERRGVMSRPPDKSRMELQREFRW
jgi:hypothetical protein